MTNVDEKLSEEFIQKGNQILEKFRDLNPFEDDNFYGDNAISLGGNAGSYNIESWKRARDMKDSDGKPINNPKVIVNGFGCNDIGQGQLGD